MAIAAMSAVMRGRWSGSTRSCPGSWTGCGLAIWRLFTADHGNDPTWTGTDHTRERVPVVGHGLGAREIGLIGFVRCGGVRVAAHLGVPAHGPGRSFL